MCSDFSLNKGELSTLGLKKYLFSSTVRNCFFLFFVCLFVFHHMLVGISVSFYLIIIIITMRGVLEMLQL